MAGVEQRLIQGREHLLRGQAGPAITALQIACTLLRDQAAHLPPSDQLLFDAYDCLLDLGRAYRASGDFERASACFDAAQVGRSAAGCELRAGCGLRRWVAGSA